MKIWYQPIQSLQEHSNCRALLPLFCLLILILCGCGDDENPTQPIQNVLEIKELSITDQPLEVGNTATVTALINYSGDEVDLIYTWKATSGKIFGEASSVAYLAPDRPGTDTITLELTDGFVVEKHSIIVEVVETHSLSIDSRAYWQGEDFTQNLKYQVEVTQLFRPDVKLRYEILQDRAQTGAFLSIHINNTPLVEDMAIGSVRPAEKQIVQGEIDASEVVTTLGRYEIIFTLVVVQAVEQGWQLQDAKLIGAQGSAIRQ